MSMSLEQLCADWLAAKADEAAANKRRLDIESKIVAITGKRDEGSSTHEAPGFKLSVTGKVSRKMDWAKWDQIKPQIPQELQPVKMKPELDETGVRWLKQHRPDLYDLLPIEVKPAKTAVEVKPVPAQA